METRPIQRALISVSDKTGIVEFAQSLAKKGIEILSTGGTAKLLRDSGITVIDVSEHTGQEEIMGGRVKTLHPKVHGGILGRRDIDQTVMQEQNIAPIDMVVVNLYPFAETVAKEGCTLEDAIENIDIGGPTMVRAAAKNHKDVTIVVNANDYQRVLAELEQQGGVSHSTRFDLAVAAFEHTAQYDGMIANYLGKQLSENDFARTLNLQVSKKQDLRYGENSHQSAVSQLVSPLPMLMIVLLRPIQLPPSVALLLSTVSWMKQRQQLLSSASLLRLLSRRVSATKPELRLPVKRTFVC